MKKLLGILFVLMLLVACGSDTPTETNGSTTQETPTTNGETLIDVFTRDSTSGTREAFHDGIGLDSEALTMDAVETTGNGDMAGQVGRDAVAIGYVSLTTDFEANNLRPVAYNDVEANIENVLDQSYTVSRPFSFVTRAKGDFASDETEEAVAAFIDFLMNSTEGLEAVEAEGGIVDVNNGQPWSDLSANHPVLEGDVSSITINTGGSTSVEKTLQAALEAFEATTGIGFTMNHTGSGDGYKRTLGEEKGGANYADIGFASRTFKEDGSEDIDESAVVGTGYYCLDAVVVVVSQDNTHAPESLTTQQVVSIFDGSTTTWESLQ